MDDPRRRSRFLVGMRESPRRTVPERDSGVDESVSEESASLASDSVGNDSERRLPSSDRLQHLATVNLPKLFDERLLLFERES